ARARARRAPGARAAVRGPCRCPARTARRARSSRRREHSRALPPARRRRWGVSEALPLLIVARAVAGIDAPGHGEEPLGPAQVACVCRIAGELRVKRTQRG